MGDAGFLLRSHDAGWNGGRRVVRYSVYVPRSYAASTDPEPMPTVLFLHGAGECGDCGTRQLSQGLPPAVMAAPEEWPFLVIAPQKPTAVRQWEAYSESVLGLLDDVRREFRVDEERLYLTGLSQGGHGSWELAAARPDLWAAVAPICGYGDPERYVEAVKDLPVWAFHGEADDIVPVRETRRIVKALREAGGDVRATYYPGVGHDSWTPAYRREGLADWFLQHTRAGARRG